MTPASGVRLGVRVTPRGGRDAVEGVRDGQLLVRVAASPVDGAANEAVVRLVAGALGVPPTSIWIATGLASRRKVLAIEGIDRATLIARWPDLGV